MAFSSFAVTVFPCQLPSSRGVDHPRAKIRRFDVGEPVTVYFDPEDPGSSALDVSPRVVTTVVFVAVAGGLPIAIGVLFILGVVQF